MPLSLSVLVPVRNRQNELDRVLAQIVEVLPDLTRFNVLVVDDASTDATYEVAHDWSRRYPQVRVIRQPESTGVYAAIRTGLIHTTGDVVLIARPDQHCDLSTLARIWWQTAGHEIVITRPTVATSAAWMAGRPTSPFASGIQLYRRSLLKMWATSGQDEEPLTYLVLHGYAPLMVEPTSATTKRIDGQTTASDTKRPNYLSKLRQLAWGE